MVKAVAPLFLLPRGTARIGFYFDAPRSQVFAATVDYQGERELIPHLPGCFIDWVLAGLRRDKRRALEIVRSVELMLEAIEHGEQSRLSDVPLVGDPPQVMNVVSTTVEVIGDGEHDRIRCVVRPPIVATSDFRAHGVFATLWDWAAQRTADADKRPTRLALRWQCARYRSHGLPTKRSQGEVAYRAALIAEAERTGEESYRHLAER